MIFRRLRQRLRGSSRIGESSLTVPIIRVTPDPKQAAELERRFNSLAYYPENGFHRDRLQDRKPQQRS